MSAAAAQKYLHVLIMAQGHMCAVNDDHYGTNALITWVVVPLTRQQLSACCCCCLLQQLTDDERD